MVPCVLGALGACAPGALGVIVSGGEPMPAPLNGYVGWWNGSSAVCVGEEWIVSARHVGGAPGSGFLIRGEWYRAVAVIPHPSLDIALIRVDRPLPGWHRLGPPPVHGEAVVLGGYGVTTTGPVDGAAGWNWSGEQAETWGANELESEGILLSVAFDRPGVGVKYESTFAVHDSGAGLFTVDENNNLELVGIAFSVSGWGEARWGNSGYCLSVELFRNWAAPILDAETPVTSGVDAPRSLVRIPGLSDFVGGLAVLATLATIRRRRCQPAMMGPG